MREAHLTVRRSSWRGKREDCVAHTLGLEIQSVVSLYATAEGGVLQDEGLIDRGVSCSRLKCQCQKLCWQKAGHTRSTSGMHE